MKINILLCDTFPGLLPPEIPSYESMFRELFDSVEEQVEYEVFNAGEGCLPAIMDPKAIHVITGSNSSVYEDEPWIKELLGWIQRAHAAKIRMAGICFGHQAIALALGGKVELCASGWGTGIREARILVPELMPYFPGSIALHYNHHDQVCVPPPGAVVFAESDFCPFEGFIIGRHIVTFQGHPEYTDRYNLHLLRNHSSAEPVDTVREGIRSIGLYRHTGRQAARMITDLLG